MNKEIERKKFKGQFNESDWGKLMADAQFKALWDSDDLVKAGELLAHILYGKAKTKKERQALRREFYENKWLDELTDEPSPSRKRWKF